MANIQLLPKPETYAEGQIHDALIKEVVRGFEFEKARERVREQGAAQRAQEIRHGGNRTTKFGKHVGCLDEETMFRIGQKYGFGALGDKGFMRDLFNKHTHVRTARM